MSKGNTAVLMPGEDELQPEEKKQHASSEVRVPADPPFHANDEDAQSD
jgi:hypothetical protein